MFGSLPLDKHLYPICLGWPINAGQNHQFLISSIILFICKLHNMSELFLFEMISVSVIVLDARCPEVGNIVVATGICNNEFLFCTDGKSEVQTCGALQVYDPATQACQPTEVVSGCRMHLPIEPPAIGSLPSSNSYLLALSLDHCLLSSILFSQSSMRPGIHRRYRLWPLR